MKTMNAMWNLHAVLIVTSMVTTGLARADAIPSTAQVATSSLEAEFRDPPMSARPRVWWHWLNGNITKDGIEKDLQWMKRSGIGGIQAFDASLKLAQIVDRPLAYMSPEWKDAFRFTASEADRLGFELTIAASPGWSETGGPWVPLEDGLKKLVWTETAIAGGKHFSGKLASPSSIAGPFQNYPKHADINDLMAGVAVVSRPGYYKDVAVLAIPDVHSTAMPPVQARDGEGNVLDASVLNDTDLLSGVEPSTGNNSKDAMVVLSYPAPQTVRSATLFIPDGWVMYVGGLFDLRLEASDAGVTWRPVINITSAEVPTTVSFSPVTARYFRVVLARREVGPAGGVSPPGVAMGEAMTSRLASLFSKPTRLTEFRLTPTALIDHFETKAGFAIEPNYYALSTGLAEAAGIAPEQVIDLTHRLGADGSLNWTPPKGRWRVLRLGYSLLGSTNHPASQEATGLEVDKFDAAAVRRYLEHYIGMYRDAAGNDLIGKRGIQAILADSIEVGTANWTPRLIEQFKRLRGYDPVPWLPTLTGVIIGSRQQSDAFLYDFRRTLADLIVSEHYGIVAQVAHEHGLKVYGEALEGGRPALGDDMAMRSHTDIPMAALWSYSRQQGPNLGNIADIKGAASVAHIYGQNLVAAESMTSSMAPWAYGPADLKRVIDMEFVTGVNRVMIHTSVHQPVDDKLPGLSLFIFGQYFNRHETWANLAKPWVDYIARNSLMLQHGRNVADVAYFYGEEAPLTALYGEKGITDAPKTYGYDFVNVDVLMNVLKNEGNELVSPAGARYRVLYLGGSSHKMTLPALQRLAALVEGGATVVGLAPESDPSLVGNTTEFAALVRRLWSGNQVTTVGKGRVIADTNIEASLQRIGVTSDFRIVGGQVDSDIPFIHRRLEDGDSYFLVNRQNRSETIEAHFRIADKTPELWHAETGSIEAASYRIENGAVVVPLTLLPEQSVHVVFRKPISAQALTVKQPALAKVVPLDGPWTVAFQSGRGAPASTTMAQLIPLNEHADAGIKYFSGVASYTKEFTAPRGWKPGQSLWLDLGAVHEVAEVSVNGKVAGSAWHAPYRIDIGAATRPGRNVLVIQVANLWANRLIGDAQPNAQKITWTAIPTYYKDAPLRASGIVGPVNLSIYK